VLADDNPVSLEKFVAILGPSCDIVASASNGVSALDAILQFRPDVAVLDLDMPGMNGFEVARESKKQSSPPAVVICSVHNNRQFFAAAEEAGALGYVVKSDGLRNLKHAVRAVARGQTCFPSGE